jgi:hypothetical protein
MRANRDGNRVVPMPGPEANRTLSARAVESFVPAVEPLPVVDVEPVEYDRKAAPVPADPPTPAANPT